MEKNSNTKEQAAKKYNEADNKAHEHIEALRNSKVGKIVPTEFEKVSITEVAKVSLFSMFFGNIVMYGFCYALSPTVGSSNEFPGSFKGIVMTIAILLSMGVDLYIYLSSKKNFLLLFLFLRMLAVVCVSVTLLAIGAVSVGGLFKLILVVGYIIVTLFTTYIFAIYISTLKNGAANANTDEYTPV
ncbi:hypothetical protein NECID01_1397 [Nematocida sp. AWRm77]|nr:hypothetical protein NECID01_1397 [Nematocida sp. AWRm77]